MPAIVQRYSLDATPDDVFAALTEEEPLRAWWTRYAEATPEEGAENRFEFEETGDHAVMRIDELVQGERVVWTCTDSSMLGTREWEGTRLVFDLSENNTGGTDLEFRHEGWADETDCFHICDEGWTFYLGRSLAGYLTSGEGEPFPDNYDG